ncbi:Adenylyl cyclase-associated protein [Venustampulla echinocandica]|uniref:Adenylyl cyclase-associated protein n=1 Tax=Venustampulla echinocandica TaxID=2656787 RepID=A0A370TFU0_9HELO|nr:Adenylyl cyclase-associated protein [Venustampulla echinocandica]RDL33770.1 Adenylyl cyclase-associated protein [Venustampulla echinocandica]
MAGSVKVLPTVSTAELTSIIHRLEAATSRLEDIASSTVEPPKLNGAAPTAAPTGPLPPLPVVNEVPPTPKPVFEPLPESVEDFDLFINGAVKKYVAQSNELGGPVAKQAASVLRAFTLQRDFILLTTKAKKPDYSTPIFEKLLKPFFEISVAIGEIRDANRASPFFNHLSAVSESISVLSWIAIDTKPHKHVEESLGSAQYWGNRVIIEHKDKDAKQIAWVQSYYQVFKDLAEYIKATYPQGNPWNPKGVSAEEALKTIQQSQSNGPTSKLPPPGAGAPPPPPPPGPPPPPARFDDVPKPAPAANSSGIGAVFNELNQGEAVTKGLRKVNADQMTHKNPSLRAGATVPTRSDSQSSVSSISRAKSPAPPGKKPKPESMRTKKPPVKKLDGNKWIIENYDNEPEPVEIDASIQHSIIISRCNKTTIIVKGKANAITIDNSQRLSLIIESLVSSVDVIKASNFALQVLGTLPTILMDQVDGAQVYLGKESMNTEVFSSKCSGINLNIIEGEDEDYKEVPLPEQIRTYIGEDGKVVSEIVEHSG